MVRFNFADGTTLDGRIIFSAVLFYMVRSSGHYYMVMRYKLDEQTPLSKIYRCPTCGKYHIDKDFVCCSSKKKTK